MSQRIYKSRATVYIYSIIGFLCFLIGEVAKMGAFEMFLQTFFVFVFRLLLPITAVLLAIVEAYRTFIRKEHVLIDNSGIRGPRMNCSLIPWSSILKLQFIVGPGAVILVVIGKDGREKARFKSLRAGLNLLGKIRSEIERVPVEIL